MNTKTVSLDRVHNAIKRNGKSFMFINGNNGVSVTKDLKMFDAVSPLRAIGIYTADCPSEWIEEDLAYFKFIFI